MIEQPTLFDVPPKNAQTKTTQPKTAQANAPKMQAAPTANVTICKSISEALQCKAGGLCLICPDWPTFDPNDAFILGRLAVRAVGCLLLGGTMFGGNVL